jgi:hypothetical protein
MAKLSHLIKLSIMTKLKHMAKLSVITYETVTIHETFVTRETFITLLNTRHIRIVITHDTVVTQETVIKHNAVVTQVTAVIFVTAIQSSHTSHLPSSSRSSHSVGSLAKNSASVIGRDLGPTYKVFSSSLTAGQINKEPLI